MTSNTEDYTKLLITNGTQHGNYWYPTMDHAFAKITDMKKRHGESGVSYEVSSCKHVGHGYRLNMFESETGALLYGVAHTD